MNNQEKFTTRSNKLKVHRANLRTISSYPVRFANDIIVSRQIFHRYSLFLFSFLCLLTSCLFLFLFFSFLFFFFVFFCFVFCLWMENIYSDTHTTIQAGWRKKNFHSADFRKQDYSFFGLSCELWVNDQVVSRVSYQCIISSLHHHSTLF